MWVVQSLTSTNLKEYLIIRVKGEGGGVYTAICFNCGAMLEYDEVAIQCRRTETETYVHIKHFLVCPKCHGEVILSGFSKGKENA